MTTVGPVCHLPPETNNNQPLPTGLQSVPPAQPNIASLTATVNALRQVVNRLSGQQPPSNPNQPYNNNFSTKQNNNKASWVEIARAEENVRIYQDDDKTSANYVDVTRINKLVMQDKTTGNTWQWTR